MSLDLGFETLNLTFCELILRELTVGDAGSNSDDIYKFGQETKLRNK